jgi:hypothetical protein
MNMLRFQPPVRPTKRRDQKLFAEHRRNVGDLSSQITTDRAYVDSVFKQIQEILAGLGVEWTPPERTNPPYRGSVRG